MGGGGNGTAQGDGVCGTTQGGVGGTARGSGGSGTAQGVGW